MDQFDPHRLRRRIGKAVCYAGSIAFIQSQRRHRVRASHAQDMSQSASILEWSSLVDEPQKAKFLQTTQHEVRHVLSIAENFRAWRMHFDKKLA